jgi:branched-chain amino acid transport system permease protein
MDWVNAVVQGLLLGGLYALLATGLSLVFGVMRLVNLAHGDLSILAAYLALVVVSATGLNPFLAIAVVVPIMMVGGYLLQRLLLNRSVDHGPLSPLLITFGLSVIIQNVLLDVFSADSRGLDAGQIENASIRLTDAIGIGVYPSVTLLVAVGVLGGLALLLGRTQLGRAIRATSDDHTAAQLVGIDNRHVYAVAMAIALGTAAIAGIFLGIRTTFGPSDGPTQLISAFEAVIMGGLGSLWGTLVGGMTLGVAQALGAQISPSLQLLAGHLVFLAVLILRPRGLFAPAGAREA